MNQNTQTVDFSAELYVLGALSPEERAHFEAQMHNNEHLQKQVNDFQAQMLSLSDQLPLEPVPAGFSARLEQSLDKLEFANRATSAKSPASTSLWNSLNLWRGFAMAGFLTTVFLSVQLLQTAPQIETQTRYVAVLVAPQEKTPGWIIQANTQTPEPTIELIPVGTVEIPEGKALQFWTKAEGWDKPVSLGLVKKGQSLEVNIDELPPLEANQLFELTLEDETGSPTGLPTGPIYSIGRGVVTL